MPIKPKYRICTYLIIANNCRPIEFVEPDAAAMQMVLANVLRQLIHFAIQSELGRRNSIADSSDSCPKVRIVGAQITCANGND